MLEQQRLLIKTGEPSPDRKRLILDAGTHAPLGYAAWLPCTGPRWLRWLTPPALAVHEAEDEPLLFTVQRPWGLLRRWEVRDADEHRVGTFRDWVVLDRYDRRLARIERAGPAALRFRGPEGNELASLARGAEGMELAFAAELEGEPFAKMLLLAPALVLGQDSA